jgi:hypothetical protein
MMAGAREAYDRDPRSEFQMSFVTDADPGDEHEEEGVEYLFIHRNGHAH